MKIFAHEVKILTRVVKMFIRDAIHLVFCSRRSGDGYLLSAYLHRLYWSNVSLSTSRPHGVILTMTSQGSCRVHSVHTNKPRCVHLIKATAMTASLYNVIQGDPPMCTPAGPDNCTNITFS